MAEDLPNLKPEQSDFLIEEVVKRANVLEGGNSGRSASINDKRSKAWDEIVVAFFVKYREKRSVDFLKNHYQYRKRTLKKNVAKLNKYRTATGGGYDEDSEELAKQFGPGDAQLCRLFARTPAFCGLSADLETPLHSSMLIKQEIFAANTDEGERNTGMRMRAAVGDCETSKQLLDLSTGYSGVQPQVHNGQRLTHANGWNATEWNDSSHGVLAESRGIQSLYSPDVFTMHGGMSEGTAIQNPSWYGVNGGIEAHSNSGLIDDERETSGGHDDKREKQVAFPSRGKNNDVNRRGLVPVRGRSRTLQKKPWEPLERSGYSTESVTDEDDEDESFRRQPQSKKSRLNDNKLREFQLSVLQAQKAAAEASQEATRSLLILTKKMIEKLDESNAKCCVHCSQPGGQPLATYPPFAPNEGDANIQASLADSDSIIH